MLIDVHVHTAFSEGFTVTAAEAVERCRHIGIDAIVLAECDVIPDLDEVRALSEDMSFPIFVGVDVDAADGRVIAIAPDPTDERFVSQSWASHDARPTVRDVIEALTQMDGVVIAAHPYLDDGGPFLGDALYDTEGLTAVEVLCGVRSRLSNDLALEATVATGLPAVGGSDTGPEGQRLGQYATLFADEVATQEQLVEALQTGVYWPVEIHQLGGQRRKRRRRGGGRRSRDD